jgi:hypothetical protein
MPAVAVKGDASGTTPEDKGGSGNGGGGGDDIDPIIRGLLARLPKSGAVWPKPQRKLWLQLFEGSFELIYKDESDEESWTAIPPNS